MKKGLFLLHEGIPNTIFESQVLTHVKDMDSQNVNFDIVSYNLLPKTRRISEENLSKFKRKVPKVHMTLFNGIYLFIPFLHFLNAIFFLKFIWKKKEYQFIHARSDYSAFIALLFKKIHNLPVVWDCRGDTEDEIKLLLRSKPKILKWIGYLLILPMIRFRIHYNSKNADAIIFVSEELHNLYKKKIRTKHISIIPCLVSEQKFSFDQGLRQTMREALKLDNLKTVILYSGSMIGYQYIEGLKILFAKLVKKKSNSILILTKDIDLAKQYFSHLPQQQIRIQSASFEDMVKFYNAVDIGVLIRENFRLNHVASPTKFGEYCLCGLPVILNDTVKQAESYAKKIGNYINSELDLERMKALSNAERQQIAERSKQYFSRSILEKKYLTLYDLICSTRNE